MCMKRINVDLDNELVRKGLERSGLQTKKDLVNTALKHYRNLLRNQKKEEKQS